MMLPSDCGKEGLTFTEPSLCKFEFAFDCDLHNIISRFLSTGVLPDGRVGSSVDVTNTVSDFTDLQNRLAYSQQAFEQLPVEEQSKYSGVQEWLEKQLQSHSTPSPESLSVPPMESLSVPPTDSKKDGVDDEKPIQP